MTWGAAKRDRPPEPSTPPEAGADPHRDEIKREIMRLMRGFSVEMTTGELGRAVSLPPGLAQGSRIFIPWVPGNTPAQTVRAAMRVRELGMAPVPHLAARAMADAPALDGLLEALCRDAQVDQILLVAGSRPAPAGEFDCSLQVLQDGFLQRHGIRVVGLAAHPEGNPDIDSAALAQALCAKNAFAAAHANAIHTGLVTQFCFDADPILAWERRARIDGNRLPVEVGLAGLASIATLIQYGRSCGVGASLQVLMGRAGGQGQSLRLLRLAKRLAPGQIVVAVAQARMAGPACRFTGFHFFPFGALSATVAWAAALARGDFTLLQDSDGIATDIKL